MKTFGHRFAALVSALVLTACGGTSSNNAENSVATGEGQTVVFLPQYWYEWTGHKVASTFDSTTRTAKLTNPDVDRMTAVAEHPFSVGGRYSVTLDVLDGATTAILQPVNASHDIISFVGADDDSAALVPGKPTIIDVSDDTASIYASVRLHGEQTITVGTITFTPISATQIDTETSTPNKKPDTF